MPTRQDSNCAWPVLHSGAQRAAAQVSVVLLITDHILHSGAALKSAVPCCMQCDNTTCSLLLCCLRCCKTVCA